jgi:hypothetical protein
MTSAQPRTGVRRAPAPALLWALRIAGALLLLAMAWIHWDLWRDGYRTIDVIGPAFLLDVVAGVVLALAALVAPPRLLSWAAALGALAAAGTLVALLLSTTVGLFGFTESTAAALWWESFWVELAAVVVLALLAVLSRGRQSS